MPQPVPAKADPVPVPVRVRGLPVTCDPAQDAPAVPWLDPDRLDVYRLALEFQILAAHLCRTRGIGALRDQLDRASCSVVLNIAEGAGRTAPLEKAHFYTIARGSSTECCAILDLLAARGLARPADCRRGRALLARIVSMLVRLAVQFSPRNSRPTT